MMDEIVNNLYGITFTMRFEFAAHPLLKHTSGHCKVPGEIRLEP